MSSVAFLHHSLINLGLEGDCCLEQGKMFILLWVVRTRHLSSPIMNRTSPETFLILYWNPSWINLGFSLRAVVSWATDLLFWKNSVEFVRENKDVRKYNFIFLNQFSPMSGAGIFEFLEFRKFRKPFGLLCIWKSFVVAPLSQDSTPKKTFLYCVS